VASLYSHQLRALAANLDMLTLAPAVIIFGLAGVVILLVIAQQILLIRGAFSGEDGTAGWRPSDRFQSHGPA